MLSRRFSSHLVVFLRGCVSFAFVCLFFFCFLTIFLGLKFCFIFTVHCENVRVSRNDPEIMLWVDLKVVFSLPILNFIVSH